MVFAAPSGSTTRQKEERSRSKYSNLSNRLQGSYMDDKSRDSTKMSRLDQPLRQTRDFSKAVSIFSMKKERESLGSSDHSPLPPARFVSKRKVDRNRLNDKHMRVMI